MLLRRLLAAAYDLLLVVAIILIAGLPLPLLPASSVSSLPGRIVIFTAMVLIAFCYYAISWIRAGQTVGMRAWRLQLVKRNDDARFGWIDSLFRSVVAIPAWGLAGIGVLWLLVDREKRCWHDYTPSCDVVLLPPRKAAKKTGQSAHES